MRINNGGNRSNIWGLAATNDGKYVISAGIDKQIVIWNVEGASIRNPGTIEDIILWHDDLKSIGMIYELALSPDNEFLAVGGWMGSSFDFPSYGIIRLYHFPSRRLIAVLEPHTGTTHALKFSNDSKYLVSGHSSKVINLWRMPEAVNIDTCFTSYPEKTFSGGHSDVIEDVDIHSDLIVSCSRDSTVCLWSIKSGKMIAMNHHKAEVHAVDFSPDGEIIVAGDYASMLSIYDNSLSIKQQIKTDNKIPDIAFSPDGEKFVCGSASRPHFVNVYQKIKNKWKLAYTHRGCGSHLSVCFPHNHYYITAQEDEGNEIERIDWQKRKKMRKTQACHLYMDFDFKHKKRYWEDYPSKKYGLPSGGKPVNKVGIRGQKILYSYFYGVLGTSFDLLTHEQKFNYDDNWDFEETQYSTPITQLGAYTLVSKNSTLLKVQKNNEDVSQIKRTSTSDGYSHYCYTFTPDTLIISGGSNGYLAAYTINGQEICRFRDHIDKINTIEVSEDGKYLVSGSDDMTIKLWNLEGLKEIAGNTTTSTERKPVVSLYYWNGWVLWTPDGYFCSSKGGGKQVIYQKNNGICKNAEYYPFEQFDLKYNRPDIINKRLGIGDSAYNQSLYIAYQKRLQKMGLTGQDLSSEIHAPDLSIKTKSQTTDKQKIEIDFSAKDTKYKLRSINVWVNDVPVYGRKGIDISNKNVKAVDKNLKIELSKNLDEEKTKNKIQISVTNEKGVESKKKTINVFCTATVKKHKVYVLTIGVSKYKNPKFNLQYAAKDAMDIAKLYSEYKWRPFKNVHVVNILNEHATKDSILALKQILQKTNVNDFVILFYAGHGLLDEKLDYYLATYDIDFNNPAKNGLPYQELENLLDSIPARKKLMLIDACHSGEVDKEEELLLADASAVKGKVRFRSIDAGRGFKKISKVSYKNSFELMKELFADLRRGTGAIVISSAGGGEFAYEGDDWKNGVFSYSIIEGLTKADIDRNDDNTISVSELRNYVFDKVSKLTDGRQNPTSRRENLEFDFRVW